MLSNYEKLVSRYSWYDRVDFGISERIVTPNTAFIVLEKAEDYMKYNIRPPKDLEEECDQLNYVWKNTREERIKWNQLDDVAMMNKVTDEYNRRIRAIDKKAIITFWSPPTLPETKQRFSSSLTEVNPKPIQNMPTGSVSGLQITNQRLEEVVVEDMAPPESAIVMSVVRSGNVLSGTTVEQAVLVKLPE
jgi:hypothetical protein